MVKIPSIIRLANEKLGAIMQRPAFHSFDWQVVSFGSGIGIYFALPFEPQIPVLGGVLVIFILAAVFCLRQKRSYSLFVFGIIVFAGLSWGRIHSITEARPILPDSERVYSVTGWVEAIEASGNRFRMRIRVKSIDGMAPEDTPKKVRVRTKLESFGVGDSIRLRAIISAPPGPVVPRGYDPARRAFFDQIGGYGFAIGTPEPAEISELGHLEAFQRGVARLRYQLAQRVMRNSPENTAGLQAALITGIRAYIPQEQTDALRVAGLAHVLAISGLHMGLLAGGAYYLASLGLALIIPLSRRYDIRKPAAIIGALAATYYLGLSGASVATQRAYIMAIIVFAAIILHRRAFSIRSVSIAALLTLLLHPESLISVGFQMSFAAVAALVIVYGEWRKHRRYKPGRGIIFRFRNAIVSLSVTSFVAGTATSLFAMLHFNRTANYGLIGNLLGMPLFTFMIMPLGFLSLVLMPLGLEWLPLWGMSLGIEGLLVVSNWTASLKGAMWYMPAAPWWLIGVIGLSYVWVCLGPNNRRIAGLVVLLGTSIFWFTKPTPDLRISDQGQVAFWSSEHGNRLYVGRKRSDRYGREQFAQMAGRHDPDIISYEDGFAKCDQRGCTFTLVDKNIAVITHPEELDEVCMHSDLVVLHNRWAGPVSRRNCAARLIDNRVLRQTGALDVYLNDTGIDVVPALTDARNNRPWG